MSTITRTLQKLCRTHGLAGYDIVKFGNAYALEQGSLAYFADEKTAKHPFYIGPSQLAVCATFSKSLDYWCTQFETLYDFVENFELAFLLSWSRSKYTNKKDPSYLEYEPDLEKNMCKGMPWPIWNLIPDMKNIKELDYDENEALFMEYCEAEQKFHDNEIRHARPHSPAAFRYKTIGCTNEDICRDFTRVIYCKIYNGAHFTFEEVVAEWKYFIWTWSWQHKEEEGFTKEHMLELDRMVNFCDDGIIKDDVSLKKIYMANPEQIVDTEELTFEEMARRLSESNVKDERKEIPGWILTEDENLCYVFPNGATYEIEKNRLTEDDWIQHILGKGWGVMEEFIPAYILALQNAGVSHFEIVSNRTIGFRFANAKAEESYSKVIKEWELSEDGDLCYTKDHEKTYVIQKSSLTDADWIIIGVVKGWNMDEFIPAYLLALKAAGIKKLNIAVNRPINYKFKEIE